MQLTGVYMPLVACREAEVIGDALGSLHDQGVAEGGTVTEDPETSLPRADGSRPQVVEVGHVAAVENEEGIVRSDPSCAINPLPCSGVDPPYLLQTAVSHGRPSGRHAGNGICSGWAHGIMQLWRL